MILREAIELIELIDSTFKSRDSRRSSPEYTKDSPKSPLIDFGRTLEFEELYAVAEGTIRNSRALCRAQGIFGEATIFGREFDSQEPLFIQGSLERVGSILELCATTSGPQEYLREVGVHPGASWGAKGPSTNSAALLFFTQELKELYGIAHGTSGTARASLEHNRELGEYNGSFRELSGIQGSTWSPTVQYGPRYSSLEATRKMWGKRGTRLKLQCGSRREPEVVE